MSKIKWPEIAPILDEKNITIGPYKVNDECGCLVHWAEVVGGSNITSKIRSEIRTALKSTLGFCITWDYDEGKITKKQVADGWNEAMVLLGYTEPCDRE